MGSKVVPARQPTSRAGAADARAGERGVVLLEIVCVLAIIALLAAIILPAMPRATSRARLEAYAIDVAALITQDRTAAVRQRTQVATQVYAPQRLIVSGATGRQLRMPDDVAVDALLAARCGDRPAGLTIRFFPTGTSCGGVVALSRPGTSFQVRVNWLTGGVEIVANAH
jgi:general secretion pathway protein H